MEAEGINHRVEKNFPAGWIKEGVSPGSGKSNWSAQSSLCERRGEKRALEPNFLSEGLPLLEGSQGNITYTILLTECFIFRIVELRA